MDLRLLRYFITVVEYDSFTKASKVLYISQPSLSTAIKRLEKQIGFPLLERTTRTIALTNEGRALYKKSKNLINHLEHVINETNRLKVEGPLELAIGIIESSQFWQPRVISLFKEEYPNVQIKILEVLSLKNVEKAISDFDIHVAFTNQYITNDDIVALPIYKENLVALIPPNHYLKNKSEIYIADLTNEDFIISNLGFQTREDIFKVFQELGVKPKVSFIIERFETACMLVENNLGITIVPENYIKFSNYNNLHIRKIMDSNISRTVYMIYDKNRYLSPIILRFIDLVKTFFEIKKS